MQATELEQVPKRTPIVRRAVAGLVLIAAAALVIHFIAGVLMTVFYVALVLAVLIAVVWALGAIRG